MLVGLIFAMVHGSLVQVNCFIVGGVTDVFVGSATANRSVSIRTGLYMYTVERSSLLLNLPPL